MINFCVLSDLYYSIAQKSENLYGIFYFYINLYDFFLFIPKYTVITYSFFSCAINVYMVKY